MGRFKPLGLRSLSQESSSESHVFNVSQFPNDQSRVLIRTDPGRSVSLWTCSKLCAVTFAVGVVVGFTLKRRLRQWASKLLTKLKDG